MSALLRHHRAAAARVLAFVVAMATLIALVGVDGQARAAEASGDSLVSVKWAGGNSDALQTLQPARDPQSVHYGDFGNVAVSVSQTQNLSDQVVRVDVTGMAGPTFQDRDITSAPVSAGNFIQAMQCWGDPAAADFYKNCLFGGWGAGTAPAGTPPRNVPYTSSGMATDRGSFTLSVPFRTVQGQELASVPVGSDSPLVEWFNWKNTNEAALQVVNGDGASSFTMQLQNAASAPQLGCGDPTSATGTRCWLVVVPRGSHVTAASEGCPVDAYYRGTGMQVGSPVNPACDYWGNRIVVPLDFQSTKSSCALGGAERRSVGNETIGAAFSSWQPMLCAQGGTAHSLVTNADSVARDQLLSGGAGLAFTEKPLEASGLRTDEERAQLAETAIAYAPVAVSGLVIAFQAKKDATEYRSVKLNARLLAKLVTHSYTLQEVLSNFGDVGEKWPTGQWTTKPDQSNAELMRDPEFTLLNPSIDVDPQNSRIVLSGPNGADAIELLWRYLQADDDARAFLRGEPDPWGMTINPFYLPRGAAAANVPVTEDILQESGSHVLTPVHDAQSGQPVFRPVGLTDGDEPLCLCDSAPSTFPKAEETLGPQVLVPSTARRFDVLQFSPYAESFRAVAGLVYRRDSGSKSLWDPGKINSAGQVGDYVSVGPSSENSVFLFGVTDSASAAAFALPTASLQLPNRPGVFADADAAGMSAALTAQLPTSVEGVSVTDPAALPADAYPLSFVTYAAVNLSVSDATARSDYADLIEYATTAGQTPGQGPGQLPSGYLPLTEALKAQAHAAVETIRSYSPPTSPAPQPTSSAAPQQTPARAPAGASPATVPAAQPNAAIPQTSVSVASEATTSRTEQISSPTASLIGAVLIIGLLGLALGPFLLRRRRS